MPKKDEKITEVTEKEQVAPETAKSTPPWPLITIGVFATIVAFAVMLLICLAFLNHQASHRGVMIQRFGMNDSDTPGRMYFHQDGRSKDWQTSVDVVRGVVTAADGDTITVSGNGEQVKVKRTSNTVVMGDKSDVAVNDTVIVVGEKGDDGSVTATRIVVRNDTAGHGMMFDTGPWDHI